MAGTKKSVLAHFTYSGEPGASNGAPVAATPPSAASAGLMISGNISST